MAKEKEKKNKIDMKELENLSEEALEKMHDDLHIKFNKLLLGGPRDMTMREIHQEHAKIVKYLINAGGKHFAPIDQLDNVQNLAKEEEGKEKSKPKEIIIRGIEDFNPEKSDDEELIMDHNKLHEWQELIFEGNRLKLLDNREVTCEDLKIMHDKIVVELLNRKIPHTTPFYCRGAEEESKNKLEEFNLLKYSREESSIKSFWGIKLRNKSFEMKDNPLIRETLFSIKKKFTSKGVIIDRGNFKVIEDNENLLSIEFMGEELKGIYNFKRNSGISNVWKLSKDGAKETLSENFGGSLSNIEIRNIYFLSENKIGASEIANILSRPVQTIYSWINKLKR